MVRDTTDGLSRQMDEIEGNDKDPVPVRTDYG